MVFAAWDGQVRGALIVADTIRPTSAEAVRRLRGLGLRPVLLTGDNDRAARSAADAAGIGEVIAGALPAGKAEVVRRLQDTGRVVAMAPVMGSTTPARCPGRPGPGHGHRHRDWGGYGRGPVHRDG